MTARLHTKIARTIAPAVVIAAIVAPAALAGSSKETHVTIPASLANFREPGSTGYVPQTTRVTIPAALSRFHEPGSTGYVPKTRQMTTAAPVGGGPDWLSVLIGVGAGLGVAVTGACGLIALRKRRTLAQV